MLATVGEGAVAGEVIYGLNAIHSIVDGIGQASAFEAEAKEKNVGFFVFDVEDDGRVIHCGRAGIKGLGEIWPTVLPSTQRKRAAAAVPATATT